MDIGDLVLYNKDPEGTTWRGVIVSIKTRGHNRQGYGVDWNNNGTSGILYSSHDLIHIGCPVTPKLTNFCAECGLPATEDDYLCHNCR